VLTQNQGDNQTIQGQGFRENQHDEHTNVQLVGAVGGTGTASHAILISHALVGIPEPFSSILGPQTESSNTGISNHSDGSSGRQTRKTTTQPGSELKKTEVKEKE
jgi:hypothetical protein